MPEGQTGASSMGDGQREGSKWASLLQAAGARLVPLVVSASALLGFVAFAGAVIVWTRFFALKVPPDQVVTAVPRSELVATGSSLLLLFGFFGVLALLATYLIDRGGRATPGMARGLLALLAVEGITAILIDAEGLDGELWLALAGFAVPLLAVFAMTFLDQFTSVEDTLQARDREREPPRPRTLYSERDARGRELPLVENVHLLAALFLLLVIGAVVLVLYLSLPLPVKIVLLLVLARFLAAALGAAYLTIADVCRGLGAKWKQWERKERSKERREEQEERVREKELDAVERSVVEARKALREVRERTADAAPADEKERGKLPPEEERALQILRSYEQEARELHGDDEVVEGAGRRDKPRSYRLQFKVQGMCLAAILVLVGAALPNVVLHEPWVAGSILAAAALTLGLWRIAGLSKRGFVWFGLAVFISVPLFGTLTLMARNIDDPQVQPVALIRSTDGPDEAIQGLYVTEGDDRVYFATVATEGCEDDLRGGSGRLLWVPKEEVVAMSVGPLQSVTDAARASLEMAYALTPAVETPSGTAVSLRAEAEQAEAEALAQGESERVPRLENSGPAVRPTFGTGIRLEPENAGPDDVVTLRASAPNEGVGGFGKSRKGRNLRVGGVPAAIMKNPAKLAKQAEFVRTAAGEVLPLDKKGLYGRVDGEYVPVESGYRGDRYVKLSPDAGVERTLSPWGLGIPEGPDGEQYLKVMRSRKAPLPGRLVREQAVRRRGGEPIAVAPRLLRQAWGETEIRFRVPENASSGVVEVECEQLAGQPLLQVERPPEARVAARLLRSGRIHLDSRGSTDDGGIVVRRWAVNGRPRFRGEKKGKRGRIGRKEVSFDPPRRLGLHQVRLTVEDGSEEADTTSLYLVRVPGPAVVRREMAALRARLAKRLRGAAPTVIKVDGHARAANGSSAVERSMRAAERAVRQLLNPASAKLAQLEDSEVDVVTRAFGADCGLLPGGPAGDREVDVFVLTEDFRLTLPQQCRPRRKQAHTWSAELSTAGGEEDVAPGEVVEDRRSTD